jgi:hypothetical protein
VIKQAAWIENLRRVRRTGSLFFLALSLFVLVLPVAGSSQELAATLTGTVTDASGAVVPGATVLVS